MTFLENYADRVLFITSAALIFIPLERLFHRFKVQLNARPDMELDLLLRAVLGHWRVSCLPHLAASLDPSSSQNT